MSRPDKGDKTHHASRSVPRFDFDSDEVLQIKFRNKKWQEYLATLPEATDEQECPTCQEPDHTRCECVKRRFYDETPGASAKDIREMRKQGSVRSSRPRPLSHVSFLAPEPGEADHEGILSMATPPSLSAEAKVVDKERPRTKSPGDGERAPSRSEAPRTGSPALARSLSPAPLAKPVVPKPTDPDPKPVAKGSVSSPAKPNVSRAKSSAQEQERLQRFRLRTNIERSLQTQHALLDELHKKHEERFDGWMSLIRGSFEVRARENGDETRSLTECKEGIERLVSFLNTVEKEEQACLDQMEELQAQLQKMSAAEGEPM
jgi:hypothetical protein